MEKKLTLSSKHSVLPCSIPGSMPFEASAGVVFTLMVALLSAFGLNSCGPKQPVDNAGGDWRSLFGEPDQSWTIQGEAIWRIEDGELIGTTESGTGYVVTNRTYRDFHLQAEFFPDEGINSGIFFRCLPDSIGPVHCYEANIWDNHVDQRWRTGAIVLHQSPEARIETIDRWNTYEIKAVKDHITMWVNGIPAVDLKDTTRGEGVIALQAFGEGRIKFRNVRIRPLKVTDITE